MLQVKTSELLALLGEDIKESIIAAVKSELPDTDRINERYLCLKFEKVLTERIGEWVQLPNSLVR